MGEEGHGRRVWMSNSKSSTALSIVCLTCWLCLPGLHFICIFTILHWTVKQQNISFVLFPCVCHRRYTTASEVQVEPRDLLYSYSESRVFRHHSSLDTYSLTFPGLQQEEGEEDLESSGCCSVQREVKELRGLIQLHRDKKVS